MYPASSPLLGAAPANCHGFESHPRIICRGVDASYTPSTVAPVLTSDDATGSKNGPAPATTTRRPTATRSPLAYASAAPDANTPPPPHPTPPPLAVRLGAPRRENSRQVPARKRERAIVRPGREHKGSRLDGARFSACSV